MRYSWELPAPPDLPDVFPRRDVTHVLIEYDGPQLVILSDEHSHYFGLAADHDNDFTRWIHASTTKLEIEALVRGGIAMRDVFTGKSSLFVVDYDRDDRPIRLWRVAPAAIPKGILPVRDALLPSFVREEFEEEFAPEKDVDPRPVFRLVGRPVYDNMISFVGLAGVTLHLQRLWNAISTTIPQDPAVHHTENSRQPAPQTLLVAGVVHRSFGVEVEVVDEEIFRLIADEYSRLTRTSFYDNGLDLLLEQPRLVLDEYADYLRTLDRLQIEVMAEFGGAPVFIGHECAQRIHYELVGAQKRKNDGTPERPSVLVTEGHFEGFGMNNRTFEFYDLSAGELKKGKIDAALVKRMRDSGLTVTVNTKAVYTATISMQVKKGKTRYTLKEFSTHQPTSEH